MLFGSGELDLRSLDLHNAAHRDQLLDLLARCLASPDFSAAAPDGSQVRVIVPGGSETGAVRSTDGTALLPHLILQRRQPSVLKAKSTAAKNEEAKGTP